MGTRRRFGLLLACLPIACAPPAPRSATPATVAPADGANATTAYDERSGTGYVAWIHSDGHSADVYLASAREGAAWSAPVRVNHVPGDAAAHEQAPPQVALTGDGGVLVLWHTARAIPGRRFLASDLRFARSDDGGASFSPAIFVNDDAGGEPSSHTFHDIAVAADGTILVSWIDGRQRDAARAAAVPADAGVGSAHDHGAPDLPGSEVRVARSRDGGASFDAGVVVDRTTCPCCRTSLAIGPDGRVHVAFRRIAPDGARDVHVATSLDGGESFAAPVRVHADDWRIDGCPHAGASIGVSGDGRLHVAWYTGAGERPGIYYASSVDGRRFDRPVPLLADRWMPPAQVQLAADVRGAWLAWDDRRTPERRIGVARAEQGRVGAAAQIPVAGSAPAIATARPGALLTWTDAGLVRAARIDPR